jgi:hypothetical protein
MARSLLNTDQKKCSQENVMKNRPSLIRAAITAVFAGSAFVAAHAADIETTMTVDAQAPLSATLMPTVSVDADSTMRVADTAPLQVTLMPTVYVTARANPEFAATMLPTVRVTARIESAEMPVTTMHIVDAEDAVLDLPFVEDESSSHSEQPLALRAHTMPR